MADSIPLPAGHSIERRSWLRAFGRFLALVVVLLLCLPTWLALFARHFWLAELATHFTWQYCWVLPIPLLICLRYGSRWWATLLGVTLALNLWGVAPLFLTWSPPAAEGPFLRVMTQNVYKPNGQHERLVELIQRERPHVFLLVEVNQRWLDALRPLEELYPHRHTKLRGTASGMALYARRPLANVRFEKLGPMPRFDAFAEIEYAGRTVTLIGMHPSLPRRPINVAWRNQELLAVAKVAAEIPGPVVMMGDFNTTPWSPIFADVLQASGLRNSMRGFGVQPTWSFQGRWPLLLPIDHMLHSTDLVVQDRRVAPDIGSDHRAVLVDFVLRSASKR